MENQNNRKTESTQPPNNTNAPPTDEQGSQISNSVRKSNFIEKLKLFMDTTFHENLLCFKNFPLNYQVIPRLIAGDFTAFWHPQYNDRVIRVRIIHFVYQLFVPIANDKEYKQLYTDVYVVYAIIFTLVQNLEVEKLMPPFLHNQGMLHTESFVMVSMLRLLHFVLNYILSIFKNPISLVDIIAPLPVPPSLNHARQKVYCNCHQQRNYPKQHKF